ncbi:MAG: nuclear transport factor 2 family protein [Acidobacteriia bacterium]|nr:nuclear transport factor 2 family protein [Terriglobia bacterium]
MKKTAACFLLLIASQVMVAAGMSQRSAPVTRAEWMSALEAVVKSEQAFAQAAAEKGTRDAFLAFLAEDSVLFRPQPVPGRKWLLEHPPAPGKLSWRPVFADVSAAGDLGYTTGPYEFRKQASDTVPASYGNYFTIWQKQPGGAWKVLIDYGTPNPPPSTAVPDFDPRQASPPLAQKPGVSSEGVTDTLTALDRKLSIISMTRGAAALNSYIAEEARFLRAERQPAVGRKEVRALMPAEPGSWTWEPMKSGVSNSWDLGYTYGTFKLHTKRAVDQTAKSGFYLRVWKKQPVGDWKITIDIVSF